MPLGVDVEDPILALGDGGGRICVDGLDNGRNVVVVDGLGRDEC